MLCGNVFLTAEASANKLVLYNYPVWCILPAEHYKDFLACIKGALVSRQYLYTVSKRERDSALRLQERMLRKRCTERHETQPGSADRITRLWQINICWFNVSPTDD